VPGSSQPGVRRRRRWAQNLAVAAGASLIFCLVLELGLRWTGAAYDPQYDARGVGIIRHIDDPEIRAELPKDFDGLMLGHQVRTNSFGLRGPATTLAKPAGVFRIAVLGDSWAFGWGVGEGEPFPEVLATLLDRQGGGARVEVLNFSVWGYNTLQERAVLRAKALAFQPDLVLVAYNVNDVEELDGHTSSPTADSRLRDLETELNEHCHLFRFVDDRLRRLALRMGVERKGKIASYEKLYAETSTAWGRVREGLRDIRDISATAGAQTYLVLCPWINVLDDRNPYRGIHRQVVGEAERLGVPALDLLDAFLGRDAASLRISPLDGHPTAEGHRIAAVAIAADLRRRNLIPGL
jgi:lysophospholipase L1-like esterase